jgi:transposase-like protein
MLNYYLHLNKREYIERLNEVKDYYTDWETEVIERPMRDALKKLLESTMQVEMLGQLKAKPYQRIKVRTDYRNGSYYRNLVTKFGLLRMLEIPRPRKGGLKTKVFQHYQRRWQQINDFIREIFIAGVSTRETGLVLQGLLDTQPSASTVSTITKILDEEVKKFQSRRLNDDYRYLFLDGVWVKVGGYKVVKKVLLIAYGIKHSGQREIIGFRLAGSESATEWESFLWDLYRRGLNGDNLRLITVDGGKGLLAATSSVYPHVPRQRCWVHKLRNLAHRLPAKYRAECLAGASKIYLATNYRKACAQFRVWAREWRELVPKAVECLEADLEELLTYLKEESWLHSKVRTTNAIERLFRELRKRIRPMCSFANKESCERIVYALFKKYNKHWEERLLWKTKEFTQDS